MKNDHVHSGEGEWLQQREGFGSVHKFSLPCTLSFRKTAAEIPPQKLFLTHNLFLALNGQLAYVELTKRILSGAGGI